MDPQRIAPPRLEARLGRRPPAGAGARLRRPSPRALALGLPLCLWLAACASERERRGLADWDAAWGGFVAAREDVAPIGTSATLEDYLDLALRRSPRLQAAAQDWLAGLERVPQARGLPEPRLQYSGGIGGRHVETRLGPLRHRVSATQVIPWPGKLVHAQGVALEEAGAAGARADGARWELAYAVTAAYADYYFLAREREVTAEVLALVRRWEEVAQARIRAGIRRAHQDAIKAQVEIGRLEDRLSTLEDARPARVERLRALLALPPGFELPWPRALPARRLAVADPEVLALATARSPALREADATVEARRRGVAQARQSYFPDLMLGLEYVEVGPAANPGVRGSGDDALMGMVGVSLPIWFGRYGAGVSEARARLQAAELRREDTGHALRARVEGALLAYRDAERKVRLYRDSLIPKGDQSLRAAFVAYEAGEAEFLSLLDAERILLEFRLAFARARADREAALAELEMLIGTELSSGLEESP